MYIIERTSSRLHDCKHSKQYFSATNSFIKKGFTTLFKAAIQFLKLKEKKFYLRRDSNPRSLDLYCNALPTELLTTTRKKYKF